MLTTEDKIKNTVDASIIVAFIPLAFGINQGNTFGFTAYGFINILLGKYRQIHPVMYILMFIFLIQFAFFKA